MRAVTWQGTEHVSVETVPDPILQQPTDAIGHEPMGIVEEVGSEVTGVRPGDRVVVPFTISCGHCAMCGQGDRKSVV